MMVRMAAASSVVLFLLCSCFLASTDSKDDCDAYGAIGGSFTVPLHHQLQTSENLRWRHNKTKIFDQRRNGEISTGKPDDIHENGSLKLVNMRRSSSGAYMPEVYGTSGRSMTAQKSLFLCLLDPVSKPVLKVECDSSGNVKFTCTAAQTRDATLEWFENDKVLPKEGKWTLLRVAEEVTNSLFKCKVSNRVSSRSSDGRAQNCTESSEYDPQCCSYWVWGLALCCYNAFLSHTGFIQGSSIFPKELFGLDFRIMVSILGGMGGLALLLIIILIVCCVRGVREKRKQIQEEEELRLGWTNRELQRPQCHQHQPAGHTGPRQQHRKKRGVPQHPRSQPQSSPKRLAQASRPTTNDEQPPPIPQPRKKVAGAAVSVGKPRLPGPRPPPPAPPGGHQGVPRPAVRHNPSPGPSPGWACPKHLTRDARATSAGSSQCEGAAALL
ncbi:uncharacterized protein LOC129179162 [Dunckerocampus dactyliophorus]|uniref:uncharacterized protein LOC129179162 n=1 Tax=Dunckerocampus dactyliophorus TaxID=161453 RepID=UPI00240695E3|nr:uncharacterized protein LOC129179162 [Dunckerocampus dactyliophorus]XP_054628027.1 uncharacterized protein LOC129179162 [Dunckerocampus dactyliophorus]